MLSFPQESPYKAEDRSLADINAVLGRKDLKYGVLFNLNKAEVNIATDSVYLITMKNAKAFASSEYSR